MAAPLNDGPALSATRKKVRLLGTYLRRLPLWCAWQVTYRCNFRCRMCHYWKQKPRPSDELHLDAIDRIARKLAHFGTFLISIAGGEPLLRRDIVEVTRAISHRHITFLTTNGYLITPRLARDLFEAGLWGASVSIDYADAARHDEARGVTGAYDRAIAAIEALLAARTQPHQRVNLMSVLMNDNLGDMESLLEIAGRLGANFMVQPYAVAKTGDMTMCPPPNAGAHLLELKGRYSAFLSNRRFLARFDEARQEGVAGCKAGRAFFNIDNYGNAAVCVEKRHEPVGNLLHDGTRNIFRALKAASTGNPCTACWYNCRGEVESLYEPAGLLRALPIYFADGFRNKAV